MLSEDAFLEWSDLSRGIDNLSIKSTKNIGRKFHNPEQYKSTFIYVISNQVYADKNMYKIGKHTGSKKGLIKRYKTYLIDPILYILYPTGESSLDETNILSRVAKYRLGTSEFVQLELDKIIDLIEIYFRMKYKRNPCVKLGYTKGLVCENVLLDFESKYLQNEKCFFFPNFNFTNSNDCLESVLIRWRDKDIFHLHLGSVHEILSSFGDKESLLVDFMRSFFISFEKSNSYLYFNKFQEHGWIEFIQFTMQVLFSYQHSRMITRKEFLKKESFHERVLFILEDETPMDLVLVKAQQVEICLIMEDKNYCSLIDIEIDSKLFENIIYYFFYVF